MLSAASSGDPVVRKTSTPSASPAIVVAATCTAELTNSGRNPGALTSSR